MKGLIAFALLVGLSVATVLGLSQDIGSSKKSLNLDLPVNSGDPWETEEEDEEAPAIIFFYGQQFEGDVFVFCVDRSGSMNDQGELARAKREVIRNIRELSDQTEFAVCFFDTGVLMWPPNERPILANSQNRAAACNWVANVGVGDLSCPKEGLTRSLQSINRSPKDRRCIIYVGDGGGTCYKRGWEQQCPPEVSANADADFEQWYLDDTLVKVDQLNNKNVSINTVGVRLRSEFDINQNFVRILAQRNEGISRRID